MFSYIELVGDFLNDEVIEDEKISEGKKKLKNYFSTFYAGAPFCALS